MQISEYMCFFFDFAFWLCFLFLCNFVESNLRIRVKDKVCLLDEHDTIDVTVDRGALCVERWSRPLHNKRKPPLQVLRKEYAHCCCYRKHNIFIVPIQLFLLFQNSLLWLSYHSVISLYCFIRYCWTSWTEYACWK